jgi:hypothetical protein
MIMGSVELEKFFELDFVYNAHRIQFECDGNIYLEPVWQQLTT